MVKYFNCKDGKVMKYESIIRDVCGKNWNGMGKQTRQAAHGIAMTLSFMNGIKPNLTEMSKHLDVEPFELKLPFMRLLQSGIMSDRVDVKNDKTLLGAGYSSTGSKVDIFSNEEATRNAWCQIAAIACGVIYRSF